MRRNHRITWASRLPQKNDRIESAVENVRGKFFEASVSILLPGATHAVDVVEHGKKLQVVGRGGRVTIPARVFWDFVDAAREADQVEQILKNESMR